MSFSFVAYLAQALKGWSSPFEASVDGIPKCAYSKKRHKAGLSCGAVFGLHEGAIKRETVNGISKCDHSIRFDWVTLY